MSPIGDVTRRRFVCILPEGKIKVRPLLRCPVLSLARTPASLTDRSHSLRSLLPPPAALPSLPVKLSAAVLIRTAFDPSNLCGGSQKEPSPNGDGSFW